MSSVGFFFLFFVLLRGRFVELAFYGRVDSDINSS